MSRQNNKKQFELIALKIEILNVLFNCLLSLPYLCAQSKLEELQGHTVIPAMSHNFDLLVLFSSQFHFNYTMYEQNVDKIIHNHLYLYN